MKEMNEGARDRYYKEVSRRLSETGFDPQPRDGVRHMGERFTDIESRHTIDHVREKVTRFRDVNRSECINVLGSVWMNAVVKQQEAEKQRGADGLPTVEEIKQDAVASRALLAETIYKPEDTVRTTQLDNLMQSVVKRYSLDHRLEDD